MSNCMKILLILISSCLLFFIPDAPADSSVKHQAMVIDLEGPISSGAATFLTRGIKEAENEGAAIVIIRMDTPGGLSVSMKTMVKSILNSPIPVVVYVAPKGASAASAGVGTAFCKASCKDRAWISPSACCRPSPHSLHT